MSKRKKKLFWPRKVGNNCKLGHKGHRTFMINNQRNVWSSILVSHKLCISYLKAFFLCTCRLCNVTFLIFWSLNFYFLWWFFAMITLHFHLQPQYKYELFHINFTWLFCRGRWKWWRRAWWRAARTSEAKEGTNIMMWFNRAGKNWNPLAQWASKFQFSLVPT